MGAYGAALYSMERAPEKSTLISAGELKTFEHKVKAITCGKCSNNCRLTVNTFSSGRCFIGGNRCSKPIARSNADKGNNLLIISVNCSQNINPLRARERRSVCPWDLTCLSFFRSGTPFHTARLRDCTIRKIVKRALCFGSAHHSVRYGLLPRKASSRSHRIAHFSGSQEYFLSLYVL